MSDDESREYQDKIKRPAIDKSAYEKAEKACIGKEKSPNRLIQQSFEMLFNEDGEVIEGISRLQSFADRNELGEEEAVNLILTQVLQSDGRINEQFRKPFLFDNEYW